MKIKTVEVIRKESIDITLTQQDIIDYAVEKLLKERPDLQGKNSEASLRYEGGPLGFLACDIKSPFLTLNVEVNE